MLRFIKYNVPFLFAGIMLFFACKPSETLPTDHVALRTGTSIAILDGLTLMADSVGVFICPNNADCFAPNSASLVLNLSKGTQNHSVRLFSWIPNYGYRRPVYFANLTDSTSVELGGQQYKVILRDGKYAKSADPQSPVKAEVIVQVSPL